MVGVGKMRHIPHLKRCPLPSAYGLVHMSEPMISRFLLGGMAMLAAALPAAAQVDQAKAAAYFKEAADLCEKEGGRLWGVSLCGPMVIADAATKTIATNQPAPDAKQPPAIGFANAAMNWGGTRWSTFVWQMMPAEPRMRGRLMLHELFHRVQPQLGLLVEDGPNDHLDTPDGRYWLQLEWLALDRALGAAGATRESALRDALAFRVVRREKFPGAAESERRLEINEGLPQYTGTVASTSTRAEAVADAIEQLRQAPVINPTFVRTFPYPLGAGYGLLLDEWSPGWTRRIKATDDLGALLMTAAGLRPAESADAAAARYGGSALRVTEETREAERQRRVAELRRRFVDGPVLIVPNGRSNAYVTNGITPIPGAGTIYPSFRTTGDWGSLTAEQVLLSSDRKSLILPAPKKVEGLSVTGEGWTLTLAPGWKVRPGRRAGDLEVVLE